MRKLIWIWLSVALIWLPMMALAQETEPRYSQLYQAALSNPGSGVFLVSADTYTLSSGEFIADPEGYDAPAVRIESRAEVTVPIHVEQAGWYQIILDYYVLGSNVNDAYLSVSINGTFPYYEARNVPLYAMWADKDRHYARDSFGNQLPATPVRRHVWQNAVLNSKSFALADGLLFPFVQGDNIIRLTTNSIPLLLGTLRVSALDEIPSYAEYREAVDAVTLPVPGNVTNDVLITVQGETYDTKNHSYIFARSYSDPNLFPYRSGQRMISALYADSWRMPGDSVTWRFTVPEDGDYSITFKSSQPGKSNFPAFKQVFIDGATSFVELRAQAFPYTAEGTYINAALTAGDVPAVFRLEKGEHTITLTSTAQSLFIWYDRLLEVMGQMTDTALEIRMISGGSIDKHRDWEIEQYMPGLSDRLREQAAELSLVVDGLRAFTDVEPALLAPIRVGVDRLEAFADDPDSLVNALSVYSEGSSSFAGQIATLLAEMLYQKMTIDCIYIHAPEAQLPKPMLGFWAAVIENINNFFASFGARSSADQQQAEEGVLNVWMGRNISYVEQLRSFIEQDFTPKTGIRVQLSSMPDEAKLLLAVSAGLGPDLVLSGSNYRPFDFALRGALLDLRQFDDFGTYIRQFNSETLVPFAINDACYGLPETLSFQALFYRKDVLEKLDLPVPDTWDEVVAMLPTLERYGMSFGTQLAAAGSFKHFGVTIPFIQQFGGKVYAPDGSQVALGDPNTLRAFQLMTDLYTKYSLPQTIASFYASFRYGTMPIGMSGSDTYILLREAAPELTEQWAIAPCVGVADENGVVRRYQMASSTSCFIMGNSKMPDEAWELMKWWLSTETQANFGQTVRLIYGPEFVWNTANLDAFEQGSGYDEETVAVIMEQFGQIREIPRNPAYFAVERELSNAWNKVVLQGQPYRTAIDTAITQSNRVIARKLKEFGYMDEFGRMIKPFMPVDGKVIDGWKEQTP